MNIRAHTNSGSNGCEINRKTSEKGCDKINKSNAKQDFFSFEEDKADLKLNSFMHLIKSWHFNLYNKLEYNDIGF